MGTIAGRALAPMFLLPYNMAVETLERPIIQHPSILVFVATCTTGSPGLARIWPLPAPALTIL